MKGGEGFGILSFGVFEKMKCIFSIAPVESLEKLWECFLLEKHSTNADSASIRRVLAKWRSSVQCVSTSIGFASDTGRALLSVH